GGGAAGGEGALLGARWAGVRGGGVTRRRIAMSGWSRAVAAALAFLIAAPALASSETLGEAYRRVNPAVVVIRSRGQEVTTEGIARFREIGSGRLVSADGKVAPAAPARHPTEGPHV